jgi:hypothetical protein
MDGKPREMVLVSHVHNFIYIKNAKVAGTSIEGYFEKYCLDPSKPYSPTEGRRESVSKHGIVGVRGEGIAPHVMTEKPATYWSHMYACQLQPHMPNKFNNYFKFCVVRNPFDLMVSGFHFHHGMHPRTTPTSFKQFCYKSKLNENYDRIAINGKPAMNFYIRYEHLLKDLEKVCNRLSIPFEPERLPKYKSQHRPPNDDYRKYYDAETKEYMERLYARQLKAFGYSF